MNYVPVIYSRLIVHVIRIPLYHHLTAFKIQRMVIDTPKYYSYIHAQAEARSKPSITFLMQYGAYGMSKAVAGCPTVVADKFHHLIYRGFTDRFL